MPEGALGAEQSPAGAPAPPDLPSTLEQTFQLARCQLREYVSSRRLVVLVGLVIAIGGAMTALVAHYRGSAVADPLSFYATYWGGGASVVAVLSGVFLGGDAIAGEFSNKTGYFLMGLPISRITVYAAKYLAALTAAVGILLLFLSLLVINGVVYFGSGAFPWQLGLSFLLAVVYLLAVLGATFLLSSLFRTGAYAFVLTAVLFLFGFTLLQDLLQSLAKVEPWMVVSYAGGIVGNIFSSDVPWGFTARVVTTTNKLTGHSVTSYTPGVGEGLAIILVYFVVTTVVGLILFGREEFS